MDSRKNNEYGDNVDERTALNTDTDKDLEAQLPEVGADGDKVKYTSAANGDPAAIDVKIIDKEPLEPTFVGLSKEELAKFADDPYWVRVRWILLVLFWVAWLGMLVAAIIIIIVVPKCPPRPNLKWHQKTVLYQILVDSFQDSDNDGTGDINGIRKHLDYFQQFLNVSTLVLSPLYLSEANAGKNVHNFTEMDPRYGTKSDLQELLKKMHKMNMHLVMDINPFCTSTKSHWFNESVSKNGEFANYFIWQDQPGTQKDITDGVAWSQDSKRNAYYFHPNGPGLPQLNLHSDRVRQELQNVFRHWLNLGVDGFRVLGLDHVLDMSTSQNAFKRTANDYKKYGDGSVAPTLDSTAYDFIGDLRTTFEELSEKKFRALIVDANSDVSLPFLKGDGNSSDKGVPDLVVSHSLLSLGNDTQTTTGIRTLINNWLDNLGTDNTAGWMTSDMFIGRLPSRNDPELTNIFNMLLLTLPGTPFVYYGQEIGMTDSNASPTCSSPKDCLEALVNARSPMQWEDSDTAGFTFNSTKIWTPLAADYRDRNVAAQKAGTSGHSELKSFVSYSALRQEPSFLWGKFTFGADDNRILSYVRQAEGQDGFLVAMNLGSTSATPDFHRLASIPDTTTVAASTGVFEGSGRADEFEVGNTIKSNHVHLKPKEGVILRWSWADVA